MAFSREAGNIPRKGGDHLAVLQEFHSEGLTGEVSEMFSYRDEPIS